MSPSSQKLTSFYHNIYKRLWKEYGGATAHGKSAKELHNIWIFVCLFLIEQLKPQIFVKLSGNPHHTCSRCDIQVIRGIMMKAISLDFTEGRNGDMQK